MFCIFHTMAFAYRKELRKIKTFLKLTKVNIFRITYNAYIIELTP